MYLGTNTYDGKILGLGLLKSTQVGYVVIIGMYYPKVFII